VANLDPTKFVIDEIERINHDALQAYTWMLCVSLVVGCILAAIGWRIASPDKAKLLWEIAVPMLAAIVLVPGNAVYQRRERIATMTTYRKLISAVPSGSPDAERFATDVREILAKLGGS
jgi:hypothetical protein